MTTFLDRPREERALFNPAFIALLLHAAVRGHAERANGRAISIGFLYLIPPLALHQETRELLPATVASSMPLWIREHPGALVGLGDRVSALRPLVSDACCFALRSGLLLSAPSGMTAGRLPKRPSGSVTSEEVDRCISRSTFLGRWFAGQPDMTTALAFWGLRT